MRVVSSVLDSQNWVVVLVSHLVDYEFSKGGSMNHATTATFFWSVKNNDFSITLVKFAKNYMRSIYHLITIS